MPKIKLLPPIDDGQINDAVEFPMHDPVTDTTYRMSLTQIKNNIGSSPINVGKTIYVDPTFGDDGTALPYRQDKPFQSGDAAILVAQFGDQIRLRAGDHFCFTNWLKDGVSFYGEVGSNIFSFTTLLNGDTPLGGTVLTTPFKWGGNTRIMQCSGPLFNLRTNPSAILDLDFDYLNVTNISNGMLCQDGTVYLKVKENYDCAGRNFNFRATGNLIAEIGGRVNCSFVNIFNGCIWLSGTNWSGRAHIKAKSLNIPTNAVGGDSSHIYMDHLQGVQLTVELEETDDLSNVAQSFMRINNNASTGVNEINIKIKNISLVRPLFRIQNPTAKVNIQIDNNPLGGASLMQDGELILKNSSIKSTTAVPITLSGGTLMPLGTMIETDGINPPINNTGGTLLSTPVNVLTPTKNYYA